MGVVGFFFFFRPDETGVWNLPSPERSGRGGSRTVHNGRAGKKLLLRGQGLRAHQLRHSAQLFGCMFFFNPF